MKIFSFYCFSYTLTQTHTHTRARQNNWRGYLLQKICNIRTNYIIVPFNNMFAIILCVFLCVGSTTDCQERRWLMTLFFSSFRTMRFHQDAAHTIGFFFAAAAHRVSHWINFIIGSLRTPRTRHFFHTCGIYGELTTKIHTLYIESRRRTKGAHNIGRLLGGCCGQVSTSYWTNEQLLLNWNETQAAIEDLRFTFK